MLVSQASQKVSVLFYVQHLLGIGHLMRARRIVLALRDNDFDVTLVTGGVALPGFDVVGVNHVALPAMAVSGGDFRGLVDDGGNPVDELFKQQRCAKLLDTYHSIQPDVVLLEAFPFGRRQVRFELLPLIDAIEASSPKPILLTSIRDILQQRVKPDRDRQTTNLVKRYFDKVLVHGDPEFAALDLSFPHADDIADQIIYTGLVCGSRPKTPCQTYDVVVSAGGGAVGSHLVKVAVEAASQLTEIESWCVITGPNLPEKDFEQLVNGAPSHVSVERFRNDFPDLLSAARLSVSQAGYNTVSDVLQTRCRSVLVPFCAGGETEQSARADRLKALGLATVLPEMHLSKQQLVSAIREALAKPVNLNAEKINDDGASNTAAIVRKLVNERC